MRLSEGVDLYITRWGVAKAVGTVRHVQGTLRSYCMFSEKRELYNLYDICIEVISLWITERKRRLRSVRSVYANVSHLRQFVNWCVREGLLPASPLPERFYRHPSAAVPRFPSAPELAALLDNEHCSRQFEHRNRAIVELAYGCGLRKGELISLNLADVRGDEIRVIGKGRKERIVPLGHAARHSLIRYLGSERSRIQERTGIIDPALFLSRKGTRLLRYQRVMECWYPELKLHGLRHACATHMLKNGASTAVLQKLLGHEQLATTQQYTHLEVRDLHAMLHTHHPQEGRYGRHC